MDGLSQQPGRAGRRSFSGIAGHHRQAPPRHRSPWSRSFGYASRRYCVTTWSRLSVRWGGVRFVDFYDTVVLPSARPLSGATLVALRGQDGARTGMLLTDLLEQDVILADTLEGEPLTIEHGAPVRLVAPAHYGYKSMKYLTRLEFRSADSGYRVSALRFMDHPRARVALEERGRWAPGWLLRYLYRPLVSGTIAQFAGESDSTQLIHGY
jgi:DMSO/TMAO reductase YedYZ molybdopterin-dependent catalytic subunit